MHSGGDLLVTQKEAGQNPFALDVDLAAGATDHTVVGRTNFEVRIQKITVSIVTHANAKKITFQDTAGSPVVIAVFNDLTFAAGVDDVRVYDFGPRGTALTQDKGLDCVSDASGPVARLHIEGYYRQKAVLSVGTNTGSGTATASS